MAQEAIMEYWGMHNYCASLVGNTPATHKFTAHADKCSASTEIRHNSLSLRQEEETHQLLTNSLHALISALPQLR